MARAANIQDSLEDYESDSLSEDASERENDDVATGMVIPRRCNVYG